MRYAVLFILFAIVSGCGTVPKDNPAPAFTYEVKNFLLESIQGCKSMDSLCCYYEASYPVFSGLDARVAAKIQREIELSLSLDPEAQNKTLNQVATDFIAGYEAFRAESGDNSKWFFKGTVTVNLLTDTLISLAVDQDYFTGGAHGGMETYFINIQPIRGAKFTLDDFFRTGYEPVITQIGEKVFRKERALDDTASLINNYFEFPDNKFKLNQNYGFTQSGIIFYFNNYEIAPYAAGPTEVIIPYDEMRRWMK